MRYVIFSVLVFLSLVGISHAGIVKYYQDYLNHFDEVYHFENETDTYIRLDKDTKLIKAGYIKFFNHKGEPIVILKCGSTGNANELICKYDKID